MNARIEFPASAYNQKMRNKEVAKALRRLGAWQQLREMKDDPDPIVRRFAAERPAKPFQDRLTRFVEDDVQPRWVERKTHSMSVRIGSNLTGSPPRRPEYIRQVLLRIRYLVRHSERRGLIAWCRRMMLHDRAAKQGKKC